MGHVNWVARLDTDVSVCCQDYHSLLRFSWRVKTVDIEAVIRIWVAVGKEALVDDKDGVNSEENCQAGERHNLPASRLGQCSNHRVEKARLELITVDLRESHAERWLRTSRPFTL